MAFRIRHGSLDTIAALASEAGRTQAAERGHEQALQFAMQIQAQKNRIKLAEMQMNFQLRMAQKNMEFQFAKQQEQANNTFQMQEMIRMQKLADAAEKERKAEEEFDLAMKNIDKADFLSAEEKKQMKLNTALKHRVGPYAPQINVGKNVAAEMDRQRSLEDDFAYYTDIVSKFSTTEDVKLGFGQGYDPKAGEAAYYDEDAKKWKKATPAQTQLYIYAKTKLEQLGPQLGLDLPGKNKGSVGDPFGTGLQGPGVTTPQNMITMGGVTYGETGEVMMPTTDEVPTLDPSKLQEPTGQEFKKRGTSWGPHHKF